MYQLTNADLVWNRACSQDQLRALPGDRALADLLNAHGLVMNGGVLHAIECMTAEELSDACDGYLFFGFDDIASLLSRAREIYEAADGGERHERQLDIEYAHFIPSDSTLVKRFQMRINSKPSDFAPLRSKDVS